LRGAAGFAVYDTCLKSIHQPHLAKHEQTTPQQLHSTDCAADGTVHLLRFDGTKVWSTAVASGGALSLEWSPDVTAPEASGGSSAAAAAQQRQRQPRGPCLLVGSMDGSVSVLDAETGGLLAAAKPHTKYVVRAAFDPRGGGHIATASFDQSSCLLRLEKAEAGSSGGGAGDQQQQQPPLRLAVVRQVAHGSAAQDAAFVPPAVAPGASRVLVAVRGCSSLYSMDGETGEVCFDSLPAAVFTPHSTRDGISQPTKPTLIPPQSQRTSPRCPS
jgi:hypothetical protein